MTAELAASALPPQSTKPKIELRPFARKALNASANCWFLTAVIGQWIFACYVAVFYGGTALRGDFEAWNAVLPHGIVIGDDVGNFVIASHLLLAVVIILGGPLQLIPQIRKLAPTFHRWNGRIYMLTATVLSVGGIYMVWTRGAVGDLSQHVAITVNGLLIMLFAALALRHALARNITAHRRWALRLFIVVSGVWFFRVGLMLWLLIHQRPAGFDPQTFTGPLLTFLAFAQYLLPLAVLQVYFRVQDKGVTTSSAAMAAGLFALTLAMAAGIFAATMGMWLSRI